MVGKTNLDQFAAGLVGTRTPYGTARNPFDDRFLPGGSSSGSGAAVGGGLLTFALGTDTAGSGERPLTAHSMSMRLWHEPPSDHRALVPCVSGSEPPCTPSSVSGRHAHQRHICSPFLAAEPNTVLFKGL